MSSEQSIQNFLDDYTRALIANDAHAEDILAEYDDLTYGNNTYDDALALMTMASAIHEALQPVRMQPSSRARIKHDLMNKRPTMVSRWRFLPARVQIAALSVVLGGFALLLRGILLGEGRTLRTKREEGVHFILVRK